jgi:DNA-binding MarR family transcriptional regulator
VTCSGKRDAYAATMTEPASAASLDGDDLETWASVATLLEWLPPALDGPLQPFGLTHFEYGLLFALADASDHRLRMSVLAGYANSSLSRLSRAVSRLEGRGWVRREPDPSDGRFTLAVLTDDGLRQCDLAMPTHAANVHRLVLDVLTAQQRQQLRRIAQRMMRAVRQSGEWTGAS